ncbi:hypothetical protein SAY87_012450 [Trapa incisa]|uniref:Uncharacterized protein n=1 Tax=Trapa incisa TaxID=236973 RepID=A0AAN7JK64_9MYRT|nr:hypothetical protein SAY87_012450 [Trapa incisa]
MDVIGQSPTGPIFRSDSMEQQSFLNSYSMMEKRQLFLRSYQFSRKRTLLERVKRSLVRSKRAMRIRLRCVRKIRKLVWSKLFRLRYGFLHQRRYSRFFPFLTGNTYYYYY